MFRLRTMVLIAFAATCLIFTAMAHAQYRFCSFAPASRVTVSPAIVEQGQSVMVTTVLVNCFGIPRALTATVNVTPNNPACGSSIEAFKISAYVMPYRSRTVSYTFAAPNCEGTYAVTERSSYPSGTTRATLTVN